jgi:hypothetical protein
LRWNVRRISAASVIVPISRSRAVSYLAES